MGGFGKTMMDTYLTGAEVGRGAAYIVMISGVLLAITALTLLRLPKIRELENSNGSKQLSSPVL